MAFSLSTSSPHILLFLTILFSLILFTHQQQPLSLNSIEQESLYLALEIQWRTLFPDDLCLSSPHDAICGHFLNPNTNNSILTPHIIELNFKFVSDSADNAPCSPNFSFPLSLSSFPHILKIFSYRCFVNSPVFLLSFDRTSSELDQIVFIDNPSLSGSITGNFTKFSALKRFILTGSNISGGIPYEFTKLSSLEELTISRNINLRSEIPKNMGKLKMLRILDLSKNGLNGIIPKSLGTLQFLLKLDLSWNNLIAEILDSLKHLKRLEFLDLGFNKFGDFGIPLFLCEMQRLRVVHLSGNLRGGTIPEIWENFGGILGIGFFGIGRLRNLSTCNL